MRPLERLLTRFSLLAALPLGLAAPALLAQPQAGTEDAAPVDERVSYTFLRTLEGEATVAAAGEGVGEALEVNQPLVSGDLVRVAARSRLELALADRNRLRLGADTIVSLESMAFSGDSDQKITLLRLDEGELLLEVTDEALGDELPRVVTGNATVYIQEPGQYRIEAGTDNEAGAWTRVVTRRGFAEVVTDRGSSIVRADESIVAEGDRSARLELAAADSPDSLERWAADLTARAARGAESSRYVEPQLAYDAAPLTEAGDWVEVENVNYWRPHVEAGWRPYWQGRWDWTPSGYTWVSYEPWGWVPYHYGRWCSLPGVGWAWRPGALYSPAWVYWNWTNEWASWVPIGYYAQFYDPWYHSGFRFGVYGWAGGDWGMYSDWSFAPVHCFRDRRFHGEFRTGRDRQRDSRQEGPPRGLLTTDTRDFRPDRIDRPEDMMRRIKTRNLPPGGTDLPDVTDFVGRKGRLPDDVARVVVQPVDRADGKGRGRILDVSDGRGGRGKLDPPKVAQTPGWQQRDKSGAPAYRPGGGKQAPVDTTDSQGRGNAYQKPAVDSGKASQAYPRYLPPAATPGNGGKVDAAGRSPYSPATKQPGAGTSNRSPYDPGTKDGGSPSAGAQDQQRWKEKNGSDEPVQRVVGSVRRPAPGVDAKPPANSFGGATPKSYQGGSTPSGNDNWHATAPTDKSSVAPHNSYPYPRNPSTPSSGYDKPAEHPQNTPRATPSTGYQKPEAYPRSNPQTPPSSGYQAPRYAPRDSSPRAASPQPSPQMKSAPPSKSGSSAGSPPPAAQRSGQTQSSGKSSTTSSAPRSSSQSGQKPPRE